MSPVPDGAFLPWIREHILIEILKSAANDDSIAVSSGTAACALMKRAQNSFSIKYNTKAKQKEQGIRRSRSVNSNRITSNGINGNPESCSSLTQKIESIIPNTSIPFHITQHGIRRFHPEDLMVAKVGTLVSILISTESPEFFFYSSAVKNNHPTLPDISFDGVKHSVLRDSH